MGRRVVFPASTRIIYRTLLAVCAGSSLALAGVAVAATPVFMLQFGSFETRGEAEAQANNISTKHSGIVAKYPTSIRQITMPPDNLTVYRTQAGPLPSRDAAQTVCAQLASQGDECYVVETMLKAPPASLAVAPQLVAPAPPDIAPPSVKIETKVETAANLTPPAPAPSPTRKAVPGAAAPPADKEQALDAMEQEMNVAAGSVPGNLPAPGASPGAVIPPPRDRKTAIRPAQAPAEAEDGSLWSWLMGEDTEEEARKPAAAPPAPATAGASVSASPSVLPATASAIPVTPAKKTSSGSAFATSEPAPAPPSMINARAMPGANPIPPAPLPPSLEAPSAPPPSPPVLPAPKQTPAAREEPGFWSWLTGDDEKENSEPPVAARPPAPAAEVSLPEEKSLPAALPPGPTPVLAPPAPVVTATPAPAPALSPLAAPPAPSVTPAISFPPPPPPMRGTDWGVAKEAPPLPISAATPAPVLAAPESTGTIQVTPVLPPVGSGGAVEVGEARRVPLTQSDRVPLPPASLPAPVVGVEPASGAKVTLLAASPPSSVLPQKTLWAQIRYFENQQQALAYWERFRKANPDFPVVRLRTTSALSALKRGDERVSLRVGPFASGGFIRILCDDVEARDDSLFGDAMECGTVTDLGASANAYAPRERTAQQVLSAARYAAKNPAAASPASYWVQLGSYSSHPKAKTAWEEAKTKNSDALMGLKSEITSPPQGSQGTPVFRLQVGPFSSAMAAGEVCSRIKTNLGNCLVVTR